MLSSPWKMLASNQVDYIEPIGKNTAPMTAVGESITVTLPRSAVGDVLALSNSLLERMHHLLELNTDGSLNPLEREELETLVEMAQFGQVLSIAIQSEPAPSD